MPGIEVSLPGSHNELARIESVFVEIASESKAVGSVVDGLCLTQGSVGVVNTHGIVQELRNISRLNFKGGEDNGPSRAPIGGSRVSNIIQR